MKQSIMKTILPAMAVLLLLFAVSCKGPQKTSAVDKEETPGREQQIDKRYLKEGFVDDNTYRVVVVTAKGDCDTEESEIRRKAKKRSYSSLVNLLLSHDRKVTSNTLACITRLVEYNGEFVKKKTNCPGSRVYYYDINQRNLKRYLMSISEPR